MKANIEIQKIKTSKISQVDFDNLGFGDVFTDHMLISNYKDEKWSIPKIVPYAPLTFDPSMRALHYGQAVFEGMKAYKDSQNKLWLFRPEENAKRINISAKRLAMPELPEEWFLEGLQKLVKLEKEWVPTGEHSSLYIRPFMFASEQNIQASISNEYTFIIFCCPVKSYYSGKVNVKIADKYSRAADGGVGFAKAAGNYASQFYPTKLVSKENFQQIIWTDANTHEYLEESGTMNIFFRINDTLITAPTGTRILDGVTRKSIITLAKDRNIQVDERFLKVSELIQAAENGSLKEIFGAGTAVLVNPINEFGYKSSRWQVKTPEKSYAELFRRDIINIQYNRTEDKFGWRIAIL